MNSNKSLNSLNLHPSTLNPQLTTTPMTITICGGGSLGHVCIGVLSSHKDVKVNLLTNHPDKWNDTITVTDINGKIFNGKIAKHSESAQDVIPESDIVLLCLPGYLIKQTLERIKPYLNAKAIVGTIVSSTGFFFFAHEVLGANARLFGFQRVPYIARVGEYGKSGNLLGYKNSISIAVENIDDKETFRQSIEHLFSTPTSLLGSFYEAALTNSNPILHTGRLYSLWHNWDGTPYKQCILFYKEWTVDAAQMLIDMDKEFMSILDTLPMQKGAIPTLLDYYESHDAQSLCSKLQSITAFQNITAPMKETEQGWVPDFESRYFTEDFPFGLQFIVNLAREKGISTPVIDKVYKWGMNEQLRQRFNPEGSTLRQQQMLMLDMLLWFDKLCKKHDIKYWLSSGTLLGAVRHGGYIPWDDDVDIDMMREDYLKLKSVMASNNDDDYELQDGDTDSGYFFSYGKLRHKHSYLAETNRYDRIFEMRGIYIDLLTFEKMPRCFNKLACLSVGHSYKILNTPGISDEKAAKKVKRIKGFNHNFLFPTLRFISKMIPTKWVHRSPGIPYKSRTTYNEIFPTKEISFEGHLLPAPNDTHSYLSRMFGDYMKLPDLENIHPHSLDIQLKEYN